MTSIGIALFVFVSLCCFLAFFSMISPRRLWWLLSAWRYQNPEANEPSDAAYCWNRITAALALMFFLWMLITIPKTYVPKLPRQEFKLPPPKLPQNLTPSSYLRT